MLIKAAVLTISLILMVPFLFHPGIVFAQNASPRITSKLTGYDYQPITDEDIEMMRKDTRSHNKQIVAANMSLTDTEAKKF